MITEQKSQLTFFISNTDLRNIFNVFDQFLVDFGQVLNFTKNPRWPP